MVFTRKFKAKCSAYQVCITILEARHLQQNANPIVVVKVGNRKKRTMVRERTDCPVYNEVISLEQFHDIIMLPAYHDNSLLLVDQYFVFDFSCEFEELISTRIIIAVYMRNFLRHLKFYGSTTFELLNVWDQPDHQYYHKWAVLTDPKDLSVGPKGYVKCNIAVNVKGEKFRVHGETEGEDDIEGNLLLPIGGEVYAFGHRARYIFVVYRADGLPDMSSSCIRSDFENINSYVQISFAGMKGSTSEIWQTYSPVFNERIIFKEAFPSFCQRVRIAVKHRIDSCRSCVVAIYMLHITAISNSSDFGFLPSFGPSFVHLYESGSLPFYRGRILLSLKTEMDDPETSYTNSVETEAVAPILEKSLWKTEEYLLVGILYSACMIDRCRLTSKSITFEISIGNAGNKQFSKSQCVESNDDLSAEKSIQSKRPISESQTVPRMTGTFDGKYDYLPLGSKKPCLYVKSWWPKVEWRMYNSNSLAFIANFLESELEKLEALIAVEYLETYKTYNEMIRTLVSHCTRYLYLLDSARYEEEGGTTKLDRLRANVCRKRIEDILRRIENDGELCDNDYIHIAMIHAYRFMYEINKLRVDPQHSLPDIFIWMMIGSKRTAYSRLRSEQIIYSEEATEKGKECGQKINLFLKRLGDEMESDYIACEIELFIWLGNAKFANAFWSSIPPGYDVDYRTKNIDSLPRYIEYTQSATFQLRAHIFRGRFDPGMDASGLLDPFIVVTFHGHTSTTKVIKQNLSPFWDQTLLFPPITIYGTRDNIKVMPPKVILEVFDQDVCGTKEFCGRFMAVPLVKLATETYSPPDFPPKLEWYEFKSQRNCSGSVLAAFELIETKEEDIDVETEHKTYNIPPDIRPKMTSYRLEVLFWGIRDMKKICYMPVHKPRVAIECGGVHVKSEVMENAKKFCNFVEPRVIVDLDMPELDVYFPCVTIKAYDSRGFGCFKFAGICIIPTVSVFLRQLITEEDYEARIYGTKSSRDFHTKHQSTMILTLQSDQDSSDEESKGLIARERMQETKESSETFFQIARKLFHRERPISIKENVYDKYDDDDKFENLDWWSKYFASLEEEKSRESGTSPTVRRRLKHVATFKIYPTELEAQPEFRRFQDRLNTFELYKGKKTGDPDYDRNNMVGRFKGHISVYRWPHPEKLPCKTRTGRDAANGLYTDYPTREPVKLLVRVYVIKGVNLHPKDPITGKSDPYLYIKLGKTIINDRKNYIANQLNPIFGRVFEIEANFPRDYLLTIQVWDYDATSADDLVGETKIDIENRFYSRFRAYCGIAKSYNVSGYNAWRDREKPTEILEFLCRKNRLPFPIYDGNEVKIGKHKFPLAAYVDRKRNANKKEYMALNVLHQWQDFPICGHPLVPEHIERRPLFDENKPGLEQGRLELWIDMFQSTQLPPKPPVNITPQPPEEYEIRAIVWNTEDIPLLESQFLTGVKCSDIYVKGWIFYEDYQKTDVHYNSLTGEGNFNWRFVFRVTYSKGEHAMIVRKKTSVFSRSETEQKLPCTLHLQVWDSDHFSPDDFLGSLTLDLSRMPRGSPNSKMCTLKLLDPNLPAINLFRLTRIKAWWPFVRHISDGKYTQAGKVELELSVLTATEADKKPAGRGRDPPQNLPPPKRPETSFTWFRNPWKAFCFVVCRHYRWRIICWFLCLLFILLIASAIYAVPGYSVKRLLGA